MKEADPQPDRVHWILKAGQHTCPPEVQKIKGGQGGRHKVKLGLVPEVWHQAQSCGAAESCIAQVCVDGPVACSSVEAEPHLGLGLYISGCKGSPAPAPVVVQVGDGERSDIYLGASGLYWVWRSPWELHFLDKGCKGRGEGGARLAGATAQSSFGPRQLWWSQVSNRAGRKGQSVRTQGTLATGVMRKG